MALGFRVEGKKTILFKDMDVLEGRERCTTCHILYLKKDKGSHVHNKSTSRTFYYAVKLYLLHLNTCYGVCIMCCKIEN